MYFLHMNVNIKRFLQRRLWNCVMHYLKRYLKNVTWWFLPHKLPKHSLSRETLETRFKLHVDLLFALNLFENLDLFHYVC